MNRQTIFRVFHVCLPAILALGGSNSLAGEGNPLVVHEWGTFTVLQDDDGSAIGGLNVDDEPLPGFVHRVHAGLLSNTTGLTPLFAKGIPQRNPDVTVRLETPVLYFYPPAGQTAPLQLDVHVDLRGGWLTEFFPDAKATAPGLGKQKIKAGSLTGKTLGSLDWRGVKVGTTGSGPETTDHVWTAPRQVAAAMLTADSGESEKYLFYRGVGHFDAPLQVTSDTAVDAIDLHGNFADTLPSGDSVTLGPLWLVHVRPDGQAALRTLPAIDVGAGANRWLARAPRNFAEADFSFDAIDRLSASMHTALVAAGLYQDEASAMLATWRQAYFTSPGLRLFFVVPRAWTDARLPLAISKPCHVERVMVARIELVSPEQRALLAALRAAELSSAEWLTQASQSPKYLQFVAGRADSGELGVAIPADFRNYLDLGRFRSALVERESRLRPSPSLSAFLRVYRLASPRPSEEKPQASTLARPR
jgi:hypothetical protein